MRIALRADASTWIGSGHAVRCATLADTLRLQGGEIHFITRAMPGDRREWLADQGFQVHTLPPVTSFLEPASGLGWLGAAPDEELRQAREVLAQLEPVDWLVVDHYGLDCQWERTMRSHCKSILVIDDLADRDHDCDLLLDQNLVADWQIRYAERVPPGCRQMLGPRFSLLQPAYADWHVSTAPRSGVVRRLLVFFGGVDAANMTGRTLRALASMGRAGINVDVIVGAGNPHHDELAGLVAGIPGARLHREVATLAPLMAAADLAIGAGGTTTWERCCLGLPSLVITLAPNQEPIARELHRRGLVRWLGDAADVTEDDLVRALAAAMDEGRGDDTSRRCRQLVDGKGALRVATVLAASPFMELVLRDAEADDEALLLEWANDPEVRQYGFSPDRIEPAAHRRWLQTRLGDRGRYRIHMAEAASGIPVGQVRFERKEEGYWLIGYSIDRPFRGLGLGVRLLGDALRRQASEAPAAGFVGRVKKCNLASCRIFDRLGFSAADVGNEVIEYRRGADSP